MDEWTTRDGRRIPVTELTDEHLCNIVKMLMKNVRRRRMESRLCHRTDVEHIWGPLVAEVRRRKLKTVLGANV